MCMFVFFNDTATTEIYTLSLHDALPIYSDPNDPKYAVRDLSLVRGLTFERLQDRKALLEKLDQFQAEGEATLAERDGRSEEHTSELQSRQYLVCRLLLEKKKKISLKNTR